MPKTQTVIPNGISKDSNTSESEDEIEKVLKSHLAMDDNFSVTGTTHAKGILKPDTFKSKKKKKIHWMKKSFVPSTSTFTTSFSIPPIDSELEPEVGQVQVQVQVLKLHHIYIYLYLYLEYFTCNCTFVQHLYLHLKKSTCTST